MQLFISHKFITLTPKTTYLFKYIWINFVIITQRTNRMQQVLAYIYYVCLKKSVISLIIVEYCKI